jgi:hypothetical protein
MTKELVFDSWKGQEFSAKCPGVNIALYSVQTEVLFLELKLMTHTAIQLHTSICCDGTYRTNTTSVMYMSTISCFKHCMYCMYTHPLRKKCLYKHGYISSHCCDNLAYSFICNVALEGSKRGAVWLSDRRPNLYFVPYVDWVMQPAPISVQE